MLTRRCFVLAALVAASAAAVEETVPVGDPAAGRALYTGAQAFRAGGPPCSGCHAMGAQGQAFTASFGPDLSKSPAALDPDVLDGVLADQPYRTMKPLYSNRPITPQERADLGAWFQQVAGKSPAAGAALFVLEAALLAFALFGALMGLGRRRTVPVREQLLPRAQGGSR